MAEIANTTLNISQGVNVLEKAGFFNFLLPFFIFFLILYAILDRLKIISKDKVINALISFFISAFILLYAYYTNIQQFFMIFYTKMNVAILIFVFALTLATFIYRGMYENKFIPKGKEGIWSAVIWLTSVFVMVAAFENAPAPLGEWAKEVSGIVFGFAVLGGILALFLPRKSSGGGEE